MIKLSEKLAMAKSIKGSTPVIIICTTLVVILVSAVLTDIGYAALENYRLNENTEKTAVFGADLLTKTKMNVENEIRSFAVKNISDLNELDIKISGNLRDVTVRVEKPFSYFFLQLIGFKEKQISARCSARVSNISSVIGARPFVIEKQKLLFEKEVLLSNIKSSINTIRFIPINLGEANYKANVVYGYRKTLQAGDGVYYFSGNTAKDMFEALKTFKRNVEKENKQSNDDGINPKRNVIIPVVEEFELTGKKTMNIIGFAAFQVSDFKVDKSKVIIKGKFVRMVIKGGISDKVEDFGLTGIKLGN